MPTRNGKNYLIPHKCQQCKIFYSHKTFNYKCSECSGNPITYPPRISSPELNTWVDKHTIDISNSLESSVFRKMKKSDNVNLLAQLIHLRFEGKRLLKAKDALHLLNGCNARAHIVGSSIADWWNIKTSNRGGQWPGYMACYYGDFDNPYPPRLLPPRPPNDLLETTNTGHLCRIRKALINLLKEKN